MDVPRLNFNPCHEKLGCRCQNYCKSLKIAMAGPRGVLPYMGYIGMCDPKGEGFSAVVLINRVSIFAILPPFW